MLPAYLRLQLAPIVLKASKDVLPGGVDRLASALIEWADSTDISRSTLRKSFTKGLELGFRIMIAGYAAAAANNDSSVAQLVKSFGESAADAKARVKPLIAGLRAFMDDPPRIIPNDQKIKECVGAVVDLNPDEFDDLRAAAGGELAGSFAGTDGEDGFSQMPRNAALAASVAGALYYLGRDLPDVGKVIAYDIDDVRDAFQDRLDDAQDADDANVEEIQFLRRATKTIGKFLREMEKLVEPFERVFRETELIEKISSCDPDDIPDAVVGDDFEGDSVPRSVASIVAPSPASAPASPDSDDRRMGLDRILAELAPTPTAPAPEIGGAPAATAVASTTESEVEPGVSSGDARAAVAEPAARTEDPYLDDSLGELPPEASGATAEQIINKLHAGFRAGRFAEGWAEAKAIDAPEAVFLAALQPLRELALRQGEKATEAGAWEPLFVDLDPADYRLAFRAHVVGQPLVAHLPRFLRDASDATLAVLPWLIEADTLHKLLGDLLAEGDAEALRIVETYIRFRGATVASWLQSLIVEGRLPDGLWDATMRALSQGPRDAVLPKLQVTVDRTDLAEPVLQLVARALLYLADLDTARRVVEVLPELKTPEGVATARQYWHADRAVAFFRKLANWQEIDWLPTPWHAELGDRLSQVVPALPESDRQKLLARPDLPEAIKKPLADRLTRMKAKKLAAGITFDDLKTALVERPDDGLEKAWKDLGGKDVRVALAIFPIAPVPEAERALRDFIARGGVPETTTAAGDASPWAAVLDAFEILVNWETASAAELAPPLLKTAPPRHAARLCRLLGDLGGEMAYEALQHYLHDLGSTADGQMLASRDGLADALVSALIESGKERGACAVLRDYLKAHSDRLPTAIALASARHCVDDGDAAGIEDAVAHLGTVSYTPMILALAESLARSGHPEVSAVFEYLEKLYPSADFAPARAQMQADPADPATPAGRKHFLRDFARDPQPEQVEHAISLLGFDLEKSSLDRLARGLTRLGTEDARRALIEKLPPATSARVLATLPTPTVLDAMKRVMAGEWKPADPAAVFKSWLDTPGISARTVLESFQAFDASAWDKAGQMRTVRKLADLVTQVTENDAPENWIDTLLVILRNEGIPADSREQLLHHILNGAPDFVTKIIEAIFTQIAPPATTDPAEGTTPAPTAVGNGAARWADSTPADRTLRDQLLAWIATTGTHETELFRIKLLQEGQPPEHMLRLLDSLPDSAIAGLPKLAAWLLNEFPDDAANPRDLAFAQGRMLRCTTTEAMAEALWTKDTVKRIRTALAALRVGLPTFWGFELDNLEATKFRDAAVFVVAIDDLGLLEPVTLFGLAGLERKKTARPTAIVVAFGGWPEAAGAITALPWSRRRELPEAVGSIWQHSGQAAGVGMVFYVLRETPPVGPYAPQNSEVHTVGCSSCKARFPVGFPTTEASVKATCGHCGSRLKLKNSSYVGQ